MPVSSLCALPDRTLLDLATALRAGRVSPSASPYQVRHAVPATTELAAEELADLLRPGSAPRQALLVLDAILAERSKAGGSAIELVTSGPDAVGATRDTGVVLRELFASARHRVLVVGYAVHQGRQVFGALAERMEAQANLKVRLCLDIARRPGDTSTEASIIQRFRARFVGNEWPGRRLPEVYYDPRSLRPGTGARASLHAKCVVADGDTAFVGSANLTEAAQVRNVELGLLVRSASLAVAIERHFDGLIGRKLMLRLPLSQDFGEV